MHIYNNINGKCSGHKYERNRHIICKRYFEIICEIRDSTAVQ